MNICKDCKYCKPNTELYGEDAVKYAKCLKTSEVNGVTGATEYDYCKTHRQLPYPNLCGPKGKWFEPIKVEIDVTPKREAQKSLPAPEIEDAKYPSWKERVVKWFKK